MEERVRIGVPRHGDLDEQRIERPLARDAVHELAGGGPAAVGRELQHAPAVDGGRDRLPDGAVAEDDLLGTDVQEERHEVVGRKAVEDGALERASALAVLARETADTVDLSAR